MCNGGELFQRVIEQEYFSEQYAAHVFRQVLEAINYCHKQGVCHRDLKPENFLFETKDSTADIKVIDFGLSKIFESGKLESLLKNSGRRSVASDEDQGRDCKNFI